jgi:arabinose-5-phosphate isomerase
MFRPQLSSLPKTEILSQAREVLQLEAQALIACAAHLDSGFEQVVAILLSCSGRVAVTGVGKCADISRKFVGTLNSTGTRAYYLDPTQALHGDLGMIHQDDVALVFSHSGESDEIVRLLPSLRRLAASMAAITGNPQSTLSQNTDAAIVYGPLREACPLSLAPSTSTTLMMALGDALAFVLSRQRDFRAEDFAQLHPAGSLGRKLARVEDHMRRGSALRVASVKETVRSVFTRANRGGRRTGAVMLLDEVGRLSGIFTDSDLARLFVRRQEKSLDDPIQEVMTANPRTIHAGAGINEALEIMRVFKISELPVLDEFGRPMGLLDITDLLDFLPAHERASVEQSKWEYDFELSAA